MGLQPPTDLPGSDLIYRNAQAVLSIMQDSVVRVVVKVIKCL